MSTGGFLELITARRTLQEVESMALTRLAEYEAAIAELEAITAMRFPIKMERIFQNESNHATYCFGFARHCVGALFQKQAANIVPERNPDEVAASQASAQASAPDSRKIKYYKSAMMAGETSKTPGKDSMGTDMVPVYEGAEDTSAPSVDAGKKTPGEAAPAQAAATGSRKVKYYKSGMMLGEISKTPRKDSMGTDMRCRFTKALRIPR